MINILTIDGDENLLRKFFPREHEGLICLYKESNKIISTSFMVLSQSDKNSGVDKSKDIFTNSILLKIQQLFIAISSINEKKLDKCLDSTKLLIESLQRIDMDPVYTLIFE